MKAKQPADHRTISGFGNELGIIIAAGVEIQRSVWISSVDEHLPGFAVTMYRPHLALDSTAF